MRLLIAFLCIALNLFAYQYNSLLLKTQVSLYPKLIVLDKNVLHNIKDRKIDFVIVYEEIDKLIAQKVQEKIYKTFPNGVEDFPLEVEILNVLAVLSDNNLTNKIDALYVLKVAPQSLRGVAKMIEGKNIYSFTYDKKDLKEGFLINITIEKGIAIYVNKEVLMRNNFRFTETFFRVARIVE